MANTVKTGKLSKLQTSIIWTAYGNRVAEDRPNDRGSGADVYHAEILADYFGFQPCDRADLRKPGGQRFDRATIGVKRYNAAQVAVTRAVSRLAERGLVVPVCGSVSRWSGANLTDEAAWRCEAGLMPGQPANTGIGRSECEPVTRAPQPANTCAGLRQCEPDEEDA